MSRTDAGLAKTVSPQSSYPDPNDAVLFVPPPPPEWAVRRARLQQRLEVGVRGPLTLVTAPAGTGKTVLVSSWAAALPEGCAVVWLSLDHDASAPGAFWHLVATGLARVGVDVPPPAAPRPDGGGASFTSSIAQRIAARDDPVVLVLDCDDALSGAVASRLDSLIRRSAGQLRVVLVSRENPLLPVHRYRLAGTVVELRMADLAFTTDEARAMLTEMGVDLSASATDALVSRTRGWAAGIRLAAMSLAHRADREEAARRLAGDTGAVAEYLLAEVLDTQPKGLRQLLLDTSVVDVVRPRLGTALAGPHAERALSFLAHGNAFLEELHESPGSYRYHPLFRELLRAQLAYESPDRSVALHRVAAAWLADDGRVVDAVRHAIATGDWEAAARYVVDDLSIVSLLTDRQADTLATALRRIPKAADGTAVSIVGAARALAVGDHRGAAVGIARAQQLLDDEGGKAWPAGELAVELIKLVLARQTGDVDAALGAAATAQQLMLLQEPARLSAHPELDAAIQVNRGASLAIAGHLDTAAQALSAAVTVEHIAGREQPLIEALGNGALLAALRGDLTRSADLAARAVRVESAAGLSPARRPGAAEVALAYVDTERYDLAGGRDHVARAAVSDQTASDPLVGALLRLVRARLCRAAGNTDEALANLDGDGSGGELPAWIADQLGLEKVGILAADGRVDCATELAKTLSQPTAQAAALIMAGEPLTGEGDRETAAWSSLDHAPLAVRVESLVRSAAGHARAGREQRAVRELDQALRLAAPELLRRAFRQAPEDVWRLFRRHHQLRARHAWLTDLRAAHPRGGTGVPSPRLPTRHVATDHEPTQIVESLTDKEREVLGHLSELLTTEEIAATMFISVNTVRTHVRNILRKLAATRRNEAVRRARDLRIIPS